MGCASSKKVQNPQVLNKAGKGGEDDEEYKLKIDPGYMFVIREASANSEESAFPSRFQSHK